MTFAPPTVLNINDREATRYMVSQMLRTYGFLVREAGDGASGLHLAQAGPDAPDAIVLDVRLPDMSGHEVCRRLKADARTQSIPVLLTSAAHIGAEHRVEGLEAGADGYLVQPFESSELSATLRALLRARAAERNAQRLASELQEAVRARDEFLAIASHELKTPLTSLQLQLDFMQRGLSKEAARTAKDECRDRLTHKLDSALRQTERLTDLVADLLDVSRITQDRFSFEPAEADLEEIVREVVDRFSTRAVRSGCTIAIHTTTAGAVPMRLDRLRMEQVVTNLVANALKYGQGKPIEVRVEADEQCGRLIVRDHGIGIAPGDRERIFGRFERAVSVRHYGGLGLGLFICRRIVEAHGGTIRVESEPAQGATFVVELPRRAEALDAAAGTPPAPAT